MEGFPDYYMFRNGEGDRRRHRQARRVDRPDACGSTSPSTRSRRPAAAAEANGGTVVEQPADIGGGMGRFAVVRDTEGSEVGLWQSTDAAG